MKLTLLISTYEAPVALAKVLQGVAQQTRLPDEVFITDDGSGEATRTVIDSWRASVSFPVHHAWHPHEGFRKIIRLTKAVAASAGDYLGLTDGDGVPHRHF